LQFAICILHFAFCIASSVRADALVAIPIEGEPFRAKLVAADDRWQLTFAVGNEQRTIPAADLVRWGRCTEQGRAGGLVLADGSLLTAEVVAADKDRLTADSDLFGTLKLPLDSLAGIVLRPPSDRQRFDLLLDRLANATGDSDRLLLDNGDELAGFFEGIGDDAVTFKTDVGSSPVKIDRITAIIFNPALRRKPPVKAESQRVWAGFSDGSRLLASELILHGDSLKVTAAGQTFTAARSPLVFLQPLAGRAVYLSDLKPAEYRQTPFLDLPWPYRPDRNVSGGMLRCGGRLFVKGIGVHSAARLVFDLSRLAQVREGPGARGQGPGSPDLQISKSPNPPRRFESLVGIDDSTAGRGSVIFRVLVDGEERFASPVLRGGDAPLPVSVDVRGAKKLELIVDYADRADVLDHADWLDARITR
jgi:hypothetical protein